MMFVSEYSKNNSVTGKYISTIVFILITLKKKTLFPCCKTYIAYYFLEKSLQNNSTAHNLFCSSLISGFSVVEKIKILLSPTAQT